MPRNLYSPRLSDDVVRSLYREGRRQNIPMTRLADQLLRQALGSRKESLSPHVGQTVTPSLRAIARRPKLGAA